MLSPGSRCAPLTLSLVRHPEIQTRTVSDERSAAFIAMGMAQQMRKPVGLICTSGTAALNYAPAIAEAFFQQIPLVVFTADRPPEWIAQQDGQTLFQRELYGKHVKASYELPTDFTHPDAQWHAERILNEAINLANAYPAGPVHLNVPLREPLYPKPGEEILFDAHVRIIHAWQPEPTLSPEQWLEIRELWDSYDRKLIVGGQHPHEAALLDVLRQIQNELEIPVIGDIITNLHSLPETIRHADALLMQKNETLLASLQPELLITFGNSVLSKNLKLFLRKYRPKIHLHLQPTGTVADPFQTLTHVLPVAPGYFFKTLFNDLDYQNFLQDDSVDTDSDYFAAWQRENREAARRLAAVFRNAPFSEFEAVRDVMEAVPENSLLHLANSMPVRYANFVGLLPPQSVEVFANRGVSGIDGCTGTAVGAALATEKIVTLLTGDVAFLYDRNSLWHNYLPENLRIVVLNNHGGGIFRLLDGPAGQPELGEYFATNQPLTMELTAQQAGLTYFRCRTREELQTLLPDFFAATGGAKLLEIETETSVNEEVYRKFKGEKNG